ncbi:2750_t:CDS:2 [Cetraspora pellucida]|uniref:2750_t:CDS:1 n=1 Tax=Cetraspora pellucida TaxID=1433469 RepID=A0A9N9EN74_9GLOM|nr:2750_t:CDS:2 [Cetraspora pellucida]
MNPPPTNETFTSHHELLKYVQIFAKTQGYAVSIKRSQKDRKGETKNIALVCNRSGLYKNSLNLTDNTCSRKTASRLVNCLFELFGTRRNNIWYLEIINPEHKNYEALTNMSGHSIARRLNTEQKMIVKQMAAAGSCSHQILSTIHQNDPFLIAISKTVYNVLQSIRQERLDGCTPVQAFFDKLQESDFEFEYQYDQQNYITHLFFVHKVFIALTHTYLTILLIDCTYKTNQYKMPLMNIVNVSSFNISFFSCFAFLHDETEEDYEWALTCVAKIFNELPYSNVIVTNRELALMRAAEKIFSNTYNVLLVMASGTEQEFITKWNEFLNHYTNKPKALKYLQETWIPYKEHFVLVWTNCDLKSVHYKIVLQIESQAREIHATISSQSSNATLDSPLKPCIGTFRSMMRLPCLHIINEHLSANLTLQKVDSQLEELVNTPPVILEEPVTSKPRERPAGAKNKRTTQRNLSAFEHVEK